MLFRMVPKQLLAMFKQMQGFRVMLFRMVPKQQRTEYSVFRCFRVMLFRMVPKLLLLAGGLR
ncbi:hypothetical protein [Enterococcus faecalis]|uniref:hypothetical protein n=1 Tax=Enterococcus faecalis TaxID=1351 RepID=UPI0019E6A496|nr:hypothetical protein [Enterococcus faecalis]EGO6634082.1 hypothetical protein [Enterococcus faecalis]HAZ2723890.1 hypothetical protein [Enterococcus faecalis]